MSQPTDARTPPGAVPGDDAPAAARPPLPAALGGLTTGSVGLSVRPAGTPAQVEELRLLLERIPGVGAVRLVTGDRLAAELRIDVVRPVPLAAEVRRALGRHLRSCTKDGDHLDVRLATPVPIIGSVVPPAGPNPLNRRWEPRDTVVPPALPRVAAPVDPDRAEDDTMISDGTPTEPPAAALARGDDAADERDPPGEQRVLADLAAVFEASFTRSFSGEGLLAVDGRWLRANATLQHLLGRTEAELQRTTITALAHGDDASREARLRAAALRGEHDGHELELRMVAANGRTLPVLARMTAVRSQGEVCGFVAHVVDAATWKAPPSGAQLEIRARRG